MSHPWIGDCKRSHGPLEMAHPPDRGLTGALAGIVVFLESVVRGVGGLIQGLLEVSKLAELKSRRTAFVGKQAVVL
jgi:hypothetical protein